MIDTRFFDDRPMIRVTIAYMSGIILSYFFKTVMVKIIAMFLVLFLIMIISNVKWAKGICIGLSLCLGMVIYHWEVSSLLQSKITDYNEQIVQIYGKIQREPQKSRGKSIYKFHPYRINGKEDQYKGDIRLTVYDNHSEYMNSLERGDVITAKGHLEIPYGRRNPGGFDYRQYLLREGMVACLVAKPVDIKKCGQVSSITKTMLQIKNSRQQIIRRLFPSEEGALLEGVILGERGKIPDGILEDFKACGIFHLLAVSGFHVGVLIAFIYFITLQMGIKPKLRALLTIGVILFYIVITGGTPSVLRAGLMATIALGGILLDRESDLINSLHCACFFILIVQPQQVFDIGFQLSFIATLGIILIVPVLQTKITFLPRWLIIPFCVTLSAQIITLPFILHYFYRFSIIGLLANLILVPMVSLLIYFGFALLVTSFIMPYFFLKLFVPYIWLLIKLIIILCDKVAAFPVGQIKGWYFSWWEMLLYYVVLIIIMDGWQEHPKISLSWRQLTNRYVKIIVTVLALTKIAVAVIPQSLTVTFLDVGQGDAIFIETPNHRNILLDGGKGVGDNGGFDNGERVIIPFLYQQGIHNLDAVVISHLHDDHIGGLNTVLQEMHVQKVLGIKENYENKLFNHIKGIMQQKNITYQPIAKGNRIWLDADLYMDVLYPGADDVESAANNLNNQSLVLKMHYKNTSFLFTGDIEKEAEERLLNDHHNIDCDILKVPHHGSGSSSTLEFLQAVKPSYSIISVGKNRFGHPSDEVVERLESLTQKIFITQVNGGVSLICDGKNMVIKTTVPHH